MDRFTGCVLFFVLHFYIIVNAGQIERTKRTPEDCDCGITSDEVMSYYNEDANSVVKGSRYPWMVAIKNRGELQCSAALITRSFILTAGHCVHGDPFDNSHQCQAPLKAVVPGRCLNIEDITIGFINKDATLRKFYPIRDVIVHPDYQIVQGQNGEYTKNDIALIQMTGAVACENYRKPVCLPFNQNFVTTGRRSVIAGWGMTEPPQPGSNSPPNAKPTLTSGVLTVQEQDVCIASLSHDKNDSSFCAQGSVSACKGDSGAPLITDEDGRFYFFGVTSHLSAPGCSIEHPQFFANVKIYLRWIMDIAICCP